MKRLVGLLLISTAACSSSSDGPPLPVTLEAHLGNVIEVGGHAGSGPTAIAVVLQRLDVRDSAPVATSAPAFLWSERTVAMVPLSAFNPVKVTLANGATVRALVVNAQATGAPGTATFAFLDRLAMIDQTFTEPADPTRAAHFRRTVADLQQITADVRGLTLDAQTLTILDQAITGAQEPLIGLLALTSAQDAIAAGAFALAAAAIPAIDDPSSFPGSEAASFVALALGVQASNVAAASDESATIPWISDGLARLRELLGPSPHAALEGTIRTDVELSWMDLLFADACDTCPSGSACITCGASTGCFPPGSECCGSGDFALACVPGERCFSCTTCQAGAFCNVPPPARDAGPADAMEPPPDTGEPEDTGVAQDSGEPQDTGAAQSDASTPDAGGMCCCLFDSNHCCGDPGHLCFDPCWNCVSSAQPIAGYTCGSTCVAPEPDRCGGSGSYCAPGNTCPIGCP